jgi:ribose 5-phosphate isomerase A
VEPFDGLEQLDLAIDGADQVTPDWWLVKGGGGAHLREKVVAAAAERFVVIVSPDKLVEAVVAPVPLELLSFGLPATLHALGPATALRPGWPASPDGGVIADYTGPIDDFAAFSAWLAAMPGVLDHGIFPSAMVTDVIVGHPDGTAEALGRAA